MELTHITNFQRWVYRYYWLKGRHDLPWRQTYDPYSVMVSEVMLQQTQVIRVVPKYTQWLKRFPDITSLAKATDAEVLQMWSGLGYNRRGLHLKLTAHELIFQHKGKVPRERDKLQMLPGIGPYTAAAIRVFAFNQPEALIETNIRSVYLHHFFTHKDRVSEGSLQHLIAQTMDKHHPRDWYNALMDYGAYLKIYLPNPSRRSGMYRKQKAFTGSNRQIRGAVIKQLLLNGGQTTGVLQQVTGYEIVRLRQQLDRLENEGMIMRAANNPDIWMINDTSQHVHTD